jgi:hypothetical protein
MDAVDPPQGLTAFMRALAIALVPSRHTRTGERQVPGPLDFLVAQGREVTPDKGNRPPWHPSGTRRVQPWDKIEMTVGVRDRCAL